MTAAKRCPRCGQTKPAGQFYRRRGDRQLSSSCQPCTRAATREVRSRRQQDPTAVEGLRAVDQARQRRHRALRRQGGDGR
jgi:hypothetical protein